MAQQRQIRILWRPKSVSSLVNCVTRRGSESSVKVAIARVVTAGTVSGSREDEEDMATVAIAAAADMVIADAADMVIADAADMVTVAVVDTATGNAGLSDFVLGGTGTRAVPG